MLQATSLLMAEAAQIIHVLEAAQILRVSEGTVRLWERSGRLHAVRTSRGVRLFDRRDVERLARERELSAGRAAAEPQGIR